MHIRLVFIYGMCNVYQYVIHVYIFTHHMTVVQCLVLGVLESQNWGRDGGTQNFLSSKILSMELN